MVAPPSVAAGFRAIYRQIRADVHQLVMQEVRYDLPADVTIRDIDAAALDYVDRVWSPCFPGPPEIGNFPWRQELRHFSKKVDHFEAAYWSGGVLCGLAIGKPSERRRNMSVYMIEGLRFAPNPLKGFILGLAVATAETYARALGTEYLRLVNPVAGMLPTYLRMGLTHVNPKNAAPYCERRLP